MTLRARFYVAASDALVETVLEVVERDQVEDLVAALLGPGTHDAVLQHLARPLWNDEVPDHEVALGVRGDRGAMWFADESGTWCTKGTGPVTPPEYNEGTFPAYCEIPLDELSAAVKEFLVTARRPTGVEWQTVA
jgi:immunity protein Imm1 of predicted polymorphic toxin system